MEPPLLDGHIDADDVLPYNTTGPDIQMSTPQPKIHIR